MAICVVHIWFTRPYISPCERVECGDETRNISPCERVESGDETGNAAPVVLSSTICPQSRDFLCCMLVSKASDWKLELQQSCTTAL